MDIAPPNFNPKIFEDRGMGKFYDDGRVFGAVDEYESDGQKIIVISEWTSKFTGAGHTKVALNWMRDQGFAKIVANGVGLVEDGVGDIATAYWQHLHSQNLVDTLLDDNGADITPPKPASTMRPKIS